MRALQTRFVTQVLWATMLVVMAGILAGCPEEPLKECIAQVLYLASCGTATVVVKLDFAQGSGYLNDRGLERGLGPMRQWSSRQRDIIILSTLTVDAAILAYDRVEATSRLLLAGILVLWAARYRSSASPSTSMAAMMTGISTAILQTMLWQVGQPVAMLLHASEPSRLRYTLAVTVLPVLRLIDCELIVILVSVIHEAPQWLLASTTTYSAWTEHPGRTLAKRLDKSALVISFVGPIPTTACVVVVSIVLYHLGNRRQDRRNGTAAAAANPFPAIPLAVMTIPTMPSPTHAAGPGTRPTQHDPDQLLRRGSLDTDTDSPMPKGHTARVGSPSIGESTDPGHPHIVIKSSTQTSDGVVNTIGRVNSDGDLGQSQHGFSKHSKTIESRDVAMSYPAGSVQTNFNPQEVVHPPSPNTLVGALSLLSSPDGEVEDHEATGPFHNPSELNASVPKLDMVDVGVNLGGH